MDVANKTNNAKQFGNVLFQSIFTCFFAYAFFFGGMLRWNAVKTLQGKEYSNAEVMSIMFLLFVSTFTLAGVGTVMPSIAKAKIAGKFAFDVIDNIPGI